MSQDVGKLRCRIVQVPLYKYMILCDKPKINQKHKKIEYQNYQYKKYKYHTMLLFIFVFRRAVTELTEYENMKPWIIAKTVYISSPEPLVKEAVKMLKKLPDLILFGKTIHHPCNFKEL